MSSPDDIQNSTNVDRTYPKTQLNDANSSTSIRILAYFLILLSGFMGGAIGYGITTSMQFSPIWKSLSIILGSIGFATGIGIILFITFQAMIEWSESTIEHSDMNQTDE